MTRKETLYPVNPCGLCGKGFGFSIHSMTEAKK
jgi:hypothetical protein